MYLKNLTVLGFKSFADKTSLNFLPGVSAIVGPNGCGKSNVSDAIRWVLGEQSAKALRGGEMADVIFNGTDSRKPLGMAEVSLTIGDVDAEHLQAAGVEIGYNEVTLTRRVFRDGGSEYFINRTPCRLKDIQQLFMGTGVGRSSYSIMAQGNITQILSSKPEERRMVFEEAAGITKFKAQKREALRKLDNTEQNLLRVADLIREVKRQIGSLQRQAGKARRYKQLMTELQHLETQLARHQFDLLQTEIRQKETAIQGLRGDIETCSDGVLRGESEIARLRERLAELDHQVAGSRQQGMELKACSERHESRIQFNEERLREQDAQQTRARGDIAEAEERRQIAGQELAGVLERLNASQAALDSHRATLAERQAALQQVEADLRQRQEELRTAQAEAFDAAQQLSRARNEINALDLQKQGNVVRLEKLSSEKFQLEEERARLDARIEEFAANVEAGKLNALTQRGTVEERHQRLRELQSQLETVTTELDPLLQEQAEKKSRLNVLGQLQESHEGFTEGTLAALAQSADVLGTLADRIRVPDEHVTAIEAALGHNLQLVLINQPDAARAILSELTALHKGRASLAPLEWQIPKANSVDSSDPAVPEGTVRALRVIDADPSVARLLAGLLERTLVVPDLESATAVWRDSNGQFDFVTRAGELLNRHGVYTGGSSNSAQGPSSTILGRKNQMTALEGEIASLQERVQECSRRKGALQSEHAALQTEVQQAQNQLRTQEVEIATRQGEFNALRNSQRTLAQKIDTVVYEIQSLAAQEQEGMQKRSNLAARVDELARQEQAAQDRVTSLSEGLESLRQQRDQSQTGLTEIKVTLAGEEQNCSSLARQQVPLEQRIQELAQLIDHRRKELETGDNRRVQWEAESAESRREIDRLQHEREVVGAQTAELQGQRDRLDTEIGEREEGLRENRQRLSTLQEQRGRLEVEIAQKQMSVQNLRERIQQKYQVNLDDIRGECITITYADGGSPRVEILTPEEVAASGAATDWDAVSEQVAALQKRVDEMGPVNLVAIDEYEETEQRHQFLTGQYDDLVKAKEQLMEVINRINTQTREMFTDTFNRIRDNFRSTFTEIFGGGKADLQLVDEGDVLESGIDIVARPPGKQLQSISLLSGGEQTMTAVALLFSIYQVKPSPFCVLDELDAPLDESNINRFVRILQRFLAHSQFIIITHNKRTIGMADVLYGVTMQEQGVSKIVSVKFHKSEAESTDHQGNPLVPPPQSLQPVEEEEDAPHSREQTFDIVMAK